jgi:mannosylglycerate hydrolase
MNTLHLVSHTHWDREWYLTFQQFRLKLVILVDNLLEILDHDPHYKHFMLDGQTSVLDDYLVIRPEMHDKLKRYIRSGRIIIGPWHILPDEFLVSPEATIRNLLQGKQTCQDFGPKMEVGYIPDPFGHIGQMPQILRGFNIHSAAFRRGLSTEPCELWWQSPDGSRVFVSYLRDGYDNAAGLPTSDPLRFPEEVARLRDSLLPHTHSSHLLLMQGTDHMLPHPETYQAIASTKGKLGGDILIHSTLQNYLKDVQASLQGSIIPTVLGELRSPQKHHLLPGVLSTRIWIKQRNHFCETMLEKWAEPFSTFAESLPSTNSNQYIRQPSSILLKTWRLLMENHPHDSICGCSIDQVHDEMRVRFDQVDQIVEEITRQSLDQIVNTIDTKTNAPKNTFGTLEIFNPSSYARTDYILCELINPPEETGFDIMDGSGKSIPYQLLGSDSNELINFVLERKLLDGLIGNIQEGRFNDLSVQDLIIEREGETVQINAKVAKNSSPNLEAWRRGFELIKGFSGDPTVRYFHIRAKTPDAIRIALIASDVPGLGWKTMYMVPGFHHPVTQTKLNPVLTKIMPTLLQISQSRFGKFLWSAVSKEKNGKQKMIENEFHTLSLNKNGTFTLVDKRTGKTYPGLNQFMDGGDVGDEYNYCPPEKDSHYQAVLKDSRMEQGAVLQTLEVQLEILAPVGLETDRKQRSSQRLPVKIRTKASLALGVPRVDIHTEIENPVKDHRLRVHFPFPGDSDPVHADHDGHFEVIRRPIGVPAGGPDWIEEPRPEVPQRDFTDISNGKDGLMLANRGLPEVEVIPTDTGTDISLTLLRCVGWLSRDDFANRKGHAGPFLATPGAQMQGTSGFDYTIIPHSGSWSSKQEDGFPFQQAYSFNSPLRGVESTIHPGHLPDTNSFVHVEPATFLISSIKRTQDQKAWLIRGYNLSGDDINVNFQLLKKTKRAELVNLAEESLVKLKLDKAGTFSIPAKHHEIVTIKFIDE